MCKVREYENKNLADLDCKWNEDAESRILYPNTKGYTLSSFISLYIE